VTLETTCTEKYIYFLFFTVFILVGARREPIETENKNDKNISSIDHKLETVAEEGLFFFLLLLFILSSPLSGSESSE